MTGRDDRMDPPDGRAADEALAMDWAVGGLDPPARAAADARRMADPAFRAMCDSWAQTLEPLTHALTPEALPAALWDRIDRAIAAETQVAPPAPAQRPAAGRTRWWENLLLWQGATAGFAALSIALLVTGPTTSPPRAILQAAPPAATPALLAATLSSDRGAPLVTAALDAGRGAVLLTPVDGPDLGGRVPELWLIPADGKPRSLGLIDLGGTRAVIIPPTLLKLVADGAVLAVSLEPVGGSTTGAPTGPVVATGKLTAI